MIKKEEEEDEEEEEEEEEAVRFAHALAKSSNTVKSVSHGRG